MHHQGGVDSLEGPGVGHDDLSTPALLGRGPEDHETTAQLVGHGRRGQARPQAGGGDDVVSAPVADAR